MWSIYRGNNLNPIPGGCKKETDSAVATEAGIHASRSTPNNRNHDSLDAKRHNLKACPMRSPRLPAVVLIATLVAIPSSGAFARNTGLIFVSFGSVNHLVVIDPKANTIVKNLKTSRGPRDMLFNADHSRLYVACRDDDVIDIIDVATLEVVGKLDTLSKPETFGVDEKRRRLYVVNHEGASLAIIDMGQNIVVHEVPTDGGPGGIFVGEDGRFVYVASIVGDFIHLIDIDGGQVVDDVVVGTRPRHIAATPDGKELLVSAELSGEVYIINRSNFTVAARIGFSLPGRGATVADLLLTRDGRTAYVLLGRAAQVAVVDVPTRSIRDYIPVGERSGNIGITRDEETLFVTNVSGNDITAINIKSHEVTASIPLGRRPWTFVIDD
jgi:YVTN family beta-propeller protein